MDDMAYEIFNAPPSVDEYLRLRAVAGLSAFSQEAAAKGLAGTIFAVVLRRGGTAIGMGRLIGDGGCFSRSWILPWTRPVRGGVWAR